MKRILLLAICFVLLLSGCGANKETEQNLGLRFAYISKDLDHYWFQQVVLGIEGKCLELGIEYDTFDAHFDNETCMELVDYVIDQQYDGLMICASSQSLGPEIGQKCADAGIPVVTIDDNMLCPGPEKADKPEVWYNRSTQKEAAKWERRTSTAGKKRSRR